jgi:hypothetical protein
VIEYRELEGPLRTWLRAQPTLIALCGSHIYHAAPDISRRVDAAVPAPSAWLTFARLGGGPEANRHLSFDDALVSFNGYGRTRRQAALVAQEVLNLLGRVGNLLPEVQLETGFVIKQAQPTLWTYQQDGPIPRYVLDLAMVCVSVSTAPP